MFFVENRYLPILRKKHSPPCPPRLEGAPSPRGERAVKIARNADYLLRFKVRRGRGIRRYEEQESFGDLDAEVLPAIHARLNFLFQRASPTPFPSNNDYANKIDLTLLPSPFVFPCLSS